MGSIVPAVLASSREDFDEKLALLVRIPQVSRIQIDVVDTHFAAHASWPYATPAQSHDFSLQSDRNDKKLLALDHIAYEIDLMCLDAEAAAHAWLARGATRLTFHAESAIDLRQFLTLVRNQQGNPVSLGLALNIESDLALLEPGLGEVEYVQFMGIARIGAQGQPFDPRVLEKLRLFHARHPEVALQVDGGVSLENAPSLLALGVSTLVVGSGIVGADDPAAAFGAFEALQNSFRV